MALQDERQTAHGWPRVIFACLAVASLVFTWRGVAASSAAFQKSECVEGSLTIVAALAWLVGSAGVIHNGRRMRMLAYTAWSVNLVMPFVMLACPISQVNVVNPWYGGGVTYWYLPTIGALVAMLWLVWSTPARIATRNGA